jgi:hypothetical protein
MKSDLFLLGNYLCLVALLVSSISNILVGTSEIFPFMFFFLQLMFYFGARRQDE